MAYAEKREITAEERAQAKALSDSIRDAIKERTSGKFSDELKKRRLYIKGKQQDDGDPGLVRANIIHSNFQAILPQIYAKNPEIAVQPTEAVDPTSYQKIRGFAKTLEIVLNRRFVDDTSLKSRMEALVLSAMSNPDGWCKMIYQRDIKRDPLIENRIADTSDNLRRIEHLIREIEDDKAQRDELEANRAELQQQLAQLEMQVEVTASSGLVIDNLMYEDFFMLDDSIKHFDSYPQARRLAHRVWYSCEDYKEAFGEEPPESAKKYSPKDRGDQESAKPDPKKSEYAVFEVWDRTANTIYTIAEGADCWARQPYVPEKLGKRWYGFFGLAFNKLDGQFHGLSDVDLLMELQDEYNTTRTNQSQHRKENKPVHLYRMSGDISNETLERIANRGMNEFIGVEGAPDKPISHDFEVFQNAPVDPAVYDVTPILRDAEMVLGAGDAAKGTINKAKTATEAEIMAQGLQSRMAKRTDAVEELLTEMARYAAEILLQELTVPEVQRIAGAAAVWPGMDETKEEIFDMVSIRIRAGSTGKPNKMQEREQWTQFLPQFQQAVTTIADLRAQGQNGLADAMVKIMRESLRRFDERIDIEDFLPEQEEQAPQIPPEVTQQMQQLQEQIQMLQQANQQLQAAADDAARKERIEMAKIDQAERESNRAAAVTLRETEMKTAAEATTQETIARIRAEAERTIEADRIASAERVKAMEVQAQIATASPPEPVEPPEPPEPNEAESVLPAVLQSVADMQAQFVAVTAQMIQALDTMTKTQSAPRRTVVVRDQNGDITETHVLPMAAEG